jgi:hypothetical protein
LFRSGFIESGQCFFSEQEEEFILGFGADLFEASGDE